MRSTRRTLLGMTVAAAAGSRAVEAPATLEADEYPSNTALYAAPSLTEGVDYARRYRRHSWFDDLTQRYAVQRTAILAPHGGGIETGTSELCLAIAGYHPADLAPTDGPLHDYWMFEGLLSSGNGRLHVTSTNCDDTVARAIAGESLNAIGLHGCKPEQAGLPVGTQAVLVGGRSTAFKSGLLTRLSAAGIQAIDANSVPDLNGDEPANIANRTLLAAGAQLELTTPLRQAMFGINTRADRKHTTLPLFWTFTAATRAAITDLEATQPTA